MTLDRGELRLLRSRVVALEELLDAQERTVLEQAELLEKRTEEALGAVRAKSSFLANMSHEIRTPLNAVLGMAGLLVETELNSEQMEFAQTIRASGDHLLGVINDVLDFSKIEAGGLELELLTFDLRTCLQEAFDMIAPRAREKALDLAFLIEDGVPQGVVSDVGRLRQVLVNLLGNAVKFTGREGHVSVHVSAESASGGSTRRLRFAIRDTGCGIPPDRLASLFQAFTQADVSTTRTHGGTGLGLAISRRLVELLGGRIWVESEQGVGSCFTFEIEVEPAAAPVPISFGRDLLVSEARVLTVDDLEINRRILTQQLKAWGLQVHSCSSPAEALELLQRDSAFDLAILDYQMPEMDGLDLARAIKTQPGCDSLPIIVLSSGGTLERSKYADTSIKSVLSKPARPNKLRAEIARALGKGPPSSRKIRLLSKPELAGNLKILVAEDNPTNQRVACLILRKIGYEADVAANGLEVLEALRSRVYDVVLMDIQMPLLDGIETTRKIREGENGEDRVSIIAMTAHAMQEDADRCLAAGMDGYLTKPIRKEELKEALSALSPRRPPATQSKPTAAPSNGDPTTDPIDAEAFGRLSALCAGDDEQLASLISDHLSNSLQLVAAMKLGQIEQELESVQNAAHSLKSSTAMFGALKLSRTCSDLEAAAERGDPTDSLMSTLNDEYRRVRAALSARIKLLRG